MIRTPRGKQGDREPRRADKRKKARLREEVRRKAPCLVL